ncbi:zinc finger protein 280D isoform X4 [Takifugu rubripes]|uniref:zinc finger protein 280D isoform X4 n=1 Tax=Takifugu rubripes TaxID=31033 RepID=UPI0005D26D36|nr:zinc finger protein 280D isoform X4 [Takifugu rubripes]|eukprot:XP_011608614.1 PREDICTED: zinc finger protein 280D isoform X2 [Takifugu rubripes]
MAPVKRRRAYQAGFKLQAIGHAVLHGNRAAAREFNIAETMVRRWRKQEDDLRRAKATRQSFRGNKARWPQLEDKLGQWVIEHTAAGGSVSTNSIRLMAKAIARDMKIDDFRGGPSWCFRFMKRRNLSIRSGSTISQQLADDYEEKLDIFRTFCTDITEHKIRPEHIGNMDEMCGSKPASPNVDNGPNKRIMLVSEFYYGQFEGDAHKLMRKTNTTFKCRSCLKVLKNNIRFMNHMKHHLELEKQNSESWESHTTCQHCYRQYMTPFQLQCHIESAHSRIESSTNCKICELAFGSEQGLLEHMKEDHKPGEMPYVCQVCNYRSSFFSDVETHFRTVHENTKELLCPFCLKILRSGHMYMQHYMKHQRKGIHRCGKCRLNFLTYKEKVEHRTHVHKTFRKPKALEGLPAGTKVTIRASLTGKAPTQHSSSDRPSTVTISPDGVGERASQAVVKSRAKSTGTGAVKASMGPPSKKQCGDPSRNNLALRNLSADGGRYTCIECCSVVDHFFSHFPMVLACGACKYRTSCKVSIGNHMIKFHSTRKTPQKMDYSKNPSSLKLTLVCLNCDLLVDVSSGDLMTKHLTDQPNHICKVIQDRADIRAKDQLNVVHRQPENVAPLLMSANVQGSAEAVVKPVGIVALPPSNLPDSMRTAADEEQDSADGDVTAGPTDA